MHGSSFHRVIRPFWIIYLVFIFTAVFFSFARDAEAGTEVKLWSGVEKPPPYKSAVQNEPAIITGIYWQHKGETLKVLVTTSKRIDYSVKVLNKTDTQPFRIVLDCNGVLPGTLQPVIPVREGVLERIRTGIMSQSPPKTRIVLDMSSPADYTVTELQDDSGVCLSITKGIRIESVSWERVEGGSVLKIEGTSLSSYKVTHLRAPERIVIDVPGATISGQVPLSIGGNGAGVRRVRLGQFQINPAIARVVVDLDDNVYQAKPADTAGSRVALPIEYEVTSTDTGLVVYFYSRLVSVLQKNQGETSVLTISTSTPVNAFVRVNARVNESDSKSKGEGGLVEPVNGAGRKGEVPKGESGVINAVNDRGFWSNGGPPDAHLQIDIPFARIGCPMMEFDGESFESGEVMKVVAEEVRHSPVGVRLWVWLRSGADTPFKISSNGENGSIALQFPKVLPLRGRKIIVDPGHGGSDPGCISYSGLYEKHLTMSVARYLVTKLKAGGADVVLTRSGDETVDAYERVYLANRVGGDIYVSLHMNSFRTSQKSGIEVYYYSGVTRAKRLAQSIHKRLLENTGFVDSGVRVARFVVLRGTIMPSVVCEMGYLSNPDNERFLKNEAFHVVLAEAVYKGICDYFQAGDGKTRD